MAAGRASTWGSQRTQANAFVFVRQEVCSEPISGTLGAGVLAGGTEMD